MSPFKEFARLIGIEMIFHIEKVVERELLEFDLQEIDATQCGGEFRAVATVILNRVSEIMSGGGQGLGDSRMIVMKYGFGRPESLFLLRPQVEFRMDPLVKVFFRRSGMPMWACLFPMHFQGCP
jgi:hypothetical protein